MVAASACGHEVARFIGASFLYRVQVVYLHFIVGNELPAVCAPSAVFLMDKLSRGGGYGFSFVLHGLVFLIKIREAIVK